MTVRDLIEFQNVSYHSEPMVCYHINGNCFGYNLYFQLGYNCDLFLIEHKGKFFRSGFILWGNK